MAEHEADIPFYHIDLYRISPHNVSELGLHEYLESDGICVIEWAERAEGEIPEGSIRVRLRYTRENRREIEITGIEL
ncbi:MAG: tRNA (adenosine(37)-N6)-threonylcarbamoyltransferase complex ATPase subunit type 1 TsaE [Deferribacteres bacterium]|nr:tRNA (adenosine(37)-N6)-threonylcarbamoyltransferase complex ATPase subunit type 1 TsaE [Deferribacteres bacterium]